MGAQSSLFALIERAASEHFRRSFGPNLAVLEPDRLAARKPLAFGSDAAAPCATTTRRPSTPDPSPLRGSDRWADPHRAKLSDRPRVSHLLVLVLSRPAWEVSESPRPGRGYDRPALVRVRARGINVGPERLALEATGWCQGGVKVFTKPSPSRRVGAAMRSDPRALLVLAGVARAAVALAAWAGSSSERGGLCGFLLCL